MHKIPGIGRLNVNYSTIIKCVVLNIPNKIENQSMNLDVRSLEIGKIITDLRESGIAQALSDVIT